MTSPHPGPLHTPATNSNRITLDSQRRLRRSGRVLIVLPLLVCWPDISGGRTQEPTSSPSGSTSSIAMDRERPKPRASEKVVANEPRGVDQKGQAEGMMRSLTDGQVILALRSRDEDESHRAVEEMLSRGDRMIPLLLRLKGDSRKFVGYGLGNPKASSYLYTPSGGQKQAKGSIITVEVAALYLISAIYHESLAFAQAPYLTDGNYVKDLNYNTERRVRIAWDSVERWSQSLGQEGLVSLRAKGQAPLTGSPVRFWGSNVISQRKAAPVSTRYRSNVELTSMRTPRNEPRVGMGKDDLRVASHRPAERDSQMATGVKNGSEVELSAATSDRRVMQQGQDVFEPVPAPLRASLGEQLKLLVEYQRTQQWEKQYDLLFITFTHDESKEEYVKRNRHWYTEVVPESLIVGFVPKGTTVQESSPNAGWWTIEGCAEFNQNGGIVALQASVDAYRDRGNWYFSSVGVITPIDGEPQPCSSSSNAPLAPGHPALVNRSRQVP